MLGRQSYNNLFVLQLFFPAKQAEDLVRHVAVLLHAAEFAGVRAVGEERHHHRGVALGGEDAEGVAGLRVGLGEDGGAGLVVGADDDERVPVAFGEADGGFNGLVEVEGLLHGAGEVVAVLALVDAGAFYHQEEALPAALGEVFDGHFRGGGEVVAPVEGDGLRQVQQALGVICVVVIGVIDHRVAAADFFLRGEGQALEGGLRAGGGEEEGAAGQVGPDLVLHPAGGLMGEEGRGRGAVEVVRGEHAAGVAQRGEEFGDVGNDLLGRVHAEVAVVGLLSRGVGRAGGGGVRGEVVGGLGAHEADGAQVGHREFAAVGVQGGIDGADAHAVADHQDDVAHAAVGAVCGEGGRVGALPGGVIIAGGGFDFFVLRLRGDAEGHEGREQDEFSLHHIE